MDNYHGRITVADSIGEYSIDTIIAPTFELACVEIGTIINMFPSSIVLKCEVINRTDGTSVVITEQNEVNKTLAYDFAKKKVCEKMCFVLRKRWRSLYEAQDVYDNYMYAGGDFPELE